MKIGAAEPDELGVGVREEPPLQERIVGEVDAGHEMPRVERDLLRLGEEVVGIPVEGQTAHALHGHQLLRDDLGRVEEVEGVGVLVRLLDDLQTQFPLGVGPRLDGLPQVAPVEVRVLPGDLLGLVPQDRMHAEERLPVKLHEARLAPLVDEAEGVDPEALHHPEAARDGAVRHDPHDHVHGLRHERDEVPERVVSGGGLGDLVVRLRLDRVDQVGELHGVLDEEDRDVVAHQVEVPLRRVELHGEPPDVAGEIAGAARPRHRREAHEHGGLDGRVGEEAGPRVPGQRFGRPGSARARRRPARGRRARECARGRSA